MIIPLPSRPHAGRQSAFTIVELLIVIVVIGILAVLTIVAFNNVNTRAAQSAVRTGLKETSKRIEVDKVNRGSYAPNLGDLAGTTTTNDGVTYQYTASGVSYCLSGTLKSVAFHISNSNSTPTEGVCSGHDAPITGPITDPVVYTQTGSFDTGQPASGGLDVPITVNYDLQATDYVFVLFNAHYRTNLTMRTATNSAVANLYDKSMGASGYQRHTAFGIGGLSGQQTLTANACWSMSCTYEGATVHAGYIVYVIRGLGASPTVTNTSTAYGVQPAYGETVAPGSQSLAARRLAIFSYVYYGNQMPAESDASTPALSWTTDSTAPVTHLGTAIATRHAYATSSTTAQYQMTMPMTGSRYHGSVLFTIR